jgi:hypothetical protein
MKRALCSVVAAAILALAPSVARASMINSTIDAAITLQGTDDNGAYTIDVFSGTINVNSGYSNTYNFFRQNTYGTFSTASNQLSGAIGLFINADSVTITFNGQAQPVVLTGIFTNLPSTITSATETDSGFISGVSMPMANSFTATSLTTNAFYSGYQPGTSTSQTDVLTFGGSGPSPVPEPSTFVLAGTCLLSMVEIVRRKIRLKSDSRQVE